MTLPMDLEMEKVLRLIDLGNTVVGPTIQQTHENTAQVSEQIARQGGILIALGGGHDFAAPNFMGWARGLGPKNLKALINIDPHLDLRSLDSGPHSGTPFRQILESKAVSPQLFAEFGIRANRNAREHYQYAKKKGVKILTLDELRSGKQTIADAYWRIQKDFAAKAKQMALTLDMDSYMEGEGTSAAPVVGFTGQELIAIASLAGKNKKISYFEIAEVAPPLDPQERTSRLSAELVFSFLYSRAQLLKSK